jgi:hypothetical protein
MYIPVIVGMYYSGRRSVTETASDVGVEALAACHQRRGLNAVTEKWS